jgi:hypothetical protein
MLRHFTSSAFHFFSISLLQHFTSSAFHFFSISLLQHFTITQKEASMKNLRVVLALVVLSFVIISGLSLKAEADDLPGCSCQDYVDGQMWQGVMKINQDTCTCEIILCTPSPE